MKPRYINICFHDNDFTGTFMDALNIIIEQISPNYDAEVLKHMVIHIAAGICVAKYYSWYGIDKVKDNPNYSYEGMVDYFKNLKITFTGEDAMLEHNGEYVSVDLQATRLDVKIPYIWSH